MKPSHAAEQEVSEDAHLLSLHRRSLPVLRPTRAAHLSPAFFGANLIGRFWTFWKDGRDASGVSAGLEGSEKRGRTVRRWLSPAGPSTRAGREFST